MHFNYSWFNQDCSTQGKKEVTLQPSSWLLSPGNEWASQLCSHATPVQFSATLFSLLTTTPCCYPLTGEAAAWFCCKPVHATCCQVVYTLRQYTQQTFWQLQKDEGKASLRFSNALLCAFCWASLASPWFSFTVIPAASAFCWHSRAWGHKTQRLGENMLAFPSSWWDFVQLTGTRFCFSLEY